MVVASAACSPLSISESGTAPAARRGVAGRGAAIPSPRASFKRATSAACHRRSRRLTRAVMDSTLRGRRLRKLGPASTDAAGPTQLAGSGSVSTPTAVAVAAGARYSVIGWLRSTWRRQRGHHKIPRSPQHQSGEFSIGSGQSDIESGSSIFASPGGYAGSKRQRLLTELQCIAANGINGGGGAAANGEIGSAGDGGGTNGEAGSASAVAPATDAGPTIEIAPPGSVPRFTLDLPRPIFMLEIPAEMEIQEAEETVTAAVQAGLINCALLSDGGAASGKISEVASELRPLCEELGVKLFIQNRLEVAAASRAHGVLLGADSVSVYKVRDFLGEIPASIGGESTIYRNALVGRVVTNLEQARYASDEQADFVVVDLETVQNNNKKARNSSDTVPYVIPPPTLLSYMRKELSTNIVVTAEFCKAIGGPKVAFSGGADGVQIPAKELRELLETVTSPEPTQLPSAGRLLGAIFLIAGGTVGAGIIALPVKTAAAGFIPSTVVMVVTWMFMCLLAMLLVEASLWSGLKSNLTSMAASTMGRWGSYTTLFLYLFIYAATLTAYIAESGNLLSNMATYGNLSITASAASILFVIFNALPILFGTGLVDRVNSICLAIAVAAYGALVSFAAQSIQPALLAQGHWPSSIGALPIMVVAFTFHNIVPSLVSYLGSPKQVFLAISVGSGIPLLMYLIWEAVILGTLTPGSGLQGVKNIIANLHTAAGPSATIAVQVFSFFAIVTSFLGVGLGCVDFIADLMRSGGPFIGIMKRNKKNPIVHQGLPLLTAMIPPTIVALSAPGIFYAALEFSGTFRLILFGLIPTIMVWIGRYRLKHRSWLPGGRPVLFLIALVCVGVICLEWATKLGLVMLPMVVQ